MIPLILIIINISIKIKLQSELKIDKIAYTILVEKLRTPILTVLMKEITKLSNTMVIIVLTMILSIFFLKKVKSKRLAILLPTNLITIAMINQILKFLFRRERPIGYRIIEMNGYSFPSGHAMVSMAFYGLLIYIIYKLVKNKVLRNLLIFLNIMIIVFIGISRVYLGVHYLSDVLTGYSISVIYLLILIKVLNVYNYFP